jgi:hypothetical protein
MYELATLVKTWDVMNTQLKVRLVPSSKAAGG